jgi:osmoprotectant transport system ATP-binding protein
MIECLGLTKVYGEKRVVDAVSLEVERGQLLALVGGSGSGKTTTLRMVSRLIEPTSGTVRIDGALTTSLPGPLLRRGIGYVFQGIGLFPHLSVEQNIGITPALLGWSKARIGERVRKLLALVELEPDVAERLTNALSGGQQQRVAVARALAAHPKVLLLDEPFGALDPVTRDRLQRGFRALQQELGLTAMFVTHDMTEALVLADRIAVMHAGQVIQIGSPRELLASPAHDYVAQLFEAPRRQADRFEALRTA